MSFMTSNTKKLSLEPYKGTRDFYPREQFIQAYIFGVWKKVVESYGYLEYGASILEETELYKAKSGEEIINEQTYSFKDRGDREVTIRPEMTPTVARMVAAKRRELTFPLRWYSIPNLFRYERPQRGRLREHWQLNVDMFGVDSLDGDIELICVAYDIMKAFGAKEEDFVIRINSRKLMNAVFKYFVGASPEQAIRLQKLIDKKDKIRDFQEQADSIIGKPFIFLSPDDRSSNAEQARNQPEIRQAQDDLNYVKKHLVARGIKNVISDQALMRGFDYYTGTVFEMYDTNPENPRALFGGGRYDDLVGIFGVEKVSGVGFGWGDVTTQDFLETHGLLPEYKPTVDLYICHLDEYIEQANQLASELRQQGLRVAVDLTRRKVSQQVKTADKESIPFVLVVGEEEVKSEKFKVKSLKYSKEIVVSRGEILFI